jgi:putative ABC transport system permease protein
VALIAVLAGLFALIPTVNLVNINVSRIMERASEIGVRKAFGAPARTLVIQFLVENVLLTILGGAIGLVLSMAVLRAFNTSGILRYAQFAMNLRIFAYGMLIALAFGLLSGVYPAWRMSRLNPVDALKGGVSR